MPVSVRQARPTDDLAPLLYSSSPGMYDGLFGGEDRARRELRRASRARRHAGSFEVTLVAESDGSVLGLLAGYPAPLRAEMTRHWLVLLTCRVAPWRWPRVLRLARAARTTPAAPPGAWYVDLLVVAPASRRLGVARALIAHAESVARQAGCSLLAVDTDLGNGPARSLYRSMGMAEGAVVRTPPGLRIPGDGWIAYVKAL